MPFIFGILAAAIALFAQLVIWLFYPPLFEVTPALTVPTLVALFLLAGTEEIARLSFAYQYQKKTVTPSALAITFFALGFAGLEVGLALWHHVLQGAALLPVGLHVLLTFLAFFGLHRYAQLSQKMLFLSLFLGLVALHFLTNIAFLLL